MKKLLLAILPFLLFSAPSFAYPEYIVLNSTRGTIDELTFYQVVCRPNYIDNLGPQSLKQEEYPYDRGDCLLRYIRGTLHIDGMDIPLEYNSFGTTHAQFAIIAKKIDNKWSAKIVSADIRGDYQEPNVPGDADHQ
ncbi:hypothetical protein UB33_10520 [Photobacterium angustum]|uniref:hypothetical protein n=1 Tax=Photobacterium angustum TaxID=661 RepID=UPI0005E8B96A|nr:hypothetical protein [Photobacterium angustum]KJF93709.1 hypothetical protein UB39_14505 [Photobacterium angustum]KJG06089.1 hypothetical protein UB33_10520 [Photobacterium angustum]PSV88534.1 hypothetical protein CTN01_19970 [Photobacterium angustum]PSW81896.1 hypothetical protein CTN03_07690 [Photobacterium angustum]